MKPEFDGMTAEEMLDATDALVGVVWYLVVVLLITVSAYLGWPYFVEMLANK